MNHVKPNDLLDRAREADALYEFNRREREEELREAALLRWVIVCTLLAIGVAVYGIFR